MARFSMSVLFLTNSFQKELKGVETNAILSTSNPPPTVASGWAQPGQSIALLSHMEDGRGTSTKPFLRPLNLPLQSKFGHGLAPSRKEE